MLKFVEKSFSFEKPKKLDAQSLGRCFLKEAPIRSSHRKAAINESFRYIARPLCQNLAASSKLASPEFAV